jgi:hypothetical protein
MATEEGFKKQEGMDAFIFPRSIPGENASNGCDGLHAWVMPPARHPGVWYCIGCFQMRTFTLDEAQSLLPVLESLLKRAIEEKRSAEEAESDLTALAQRIYLSGGMRVNAPNVAKRRSDMEDHLKRVRESIAEMDAIGVQVKDLDSGLLDFPFRLEDEVVLLCWRMGEPAIEHWHTVDAGFQGRQPVDERFRRRANSSGRPN